MHNRRSGLAQTFATLALLAAFLRAFIPAGYMVTPTADHVFVVTLCSGHGAETVIDLSAGTTHKGALPTAPKKASAEAPCVFAMATTSALPQAEASIETPALSNTVEIASAVELSPGRGLAAPPPWATGPPRQA